MFADLRPYGECSKAGLPRGWDFARIRSVARLLVSNVDKLSNDEEVPVQLCNYVDVYRNDYITRGLRFMRATATPSEIRAFTVRRGDVLLTKDSESWTDIGVPAYVADETDGLVCGYHLAMLRPRARELRGEFLFRALQVPSVAAQFHVAATGVTRYGLSHGSIREVRIPLPPVADQAAIVRYLAHAHRRIDRAIAAKRKLIALLEEQKHVITRQAVTRGLDTSAPLKDAGFPWVAAAPGHWQIVELKRVLTALVDCEHKTAPYDEHGVHRVVRTTAVRGGRLDWRGTYPTSADAYESWTQRATPRASDVIFTREAPAGEACVVPEGTSVCLGQRTVLMRVDRTLMDPQFLVHQIGAGAAREQIRVATQGSTVGHLNMDDIGWMRVLMPPLSEQEEIVEHLAAVTATADAAIDRTRREIELLREFRTRLTSDVVTGQLDVRHIAATLPDLDPEEPTDDVGPAEDDLVDEAAEFLEGVDA